MEPGMSLLGAADDLKFDINHDEEDEASAEVRKKAEELQQAVANGFDDLEGLSDDDDEDLSTDQYFKPPGVIGYGGTTSTPNQEGQNFVKQPFATPHYAMGIHQNVPGAHVPKLNMYADNYANGLDLGSPTLHGHGMGDGLNGGSNGIHQNSSAPLNGQHPTHPHGTALTNEADDYVQLEVMYKARTREVERLKFELENLRESSRAEITSLQDQVTTLQANAKMYMENWNQANQALANKTTENAELSVKLSTVQNQLEIEAKSKDELMEKMKVAEATIKMLQEQVSELSSSDGLVLLKRDYENLLQTQKQKHQDELYSMHQKIDELSRNLAAKGDELRICKARFEERERQFEARLLEKADTINQLTQSLSSSQKQCQQFLENSTPHDSRKLLEQFQVLQEERGKERQRLKRLEEGVDDLYQLLVPKANMALCNPELSKSDDSLAARSLNRPTSEDAMLKVRLCCREVGHLRSEVLRARDGLSHADQELDELRRKLEMAENELARLQDKLQGRDGSETESQFQDMKDELTRQVQTLEAKLCQAEAACEQLKLQERQLLFEREALLRSCAEDKAQAIDMCKNSILEMHHSAMKRLREELLSLSEREKEQVAHEYEARIQELNSNYSTLQQTINDVKELYIRSCEEKRSLEAQIQELTNRERNVKQDTEQRLHKEFKEVLQKARPVWEEEMMKDFKQQLEQERQRWRKEFDAEKQVELAELTERLAREYEQRHSQKAEKDAEKQKEAFIHKTDQQIDHWKEVVSKLQTQIEEKDAELQQALSASVEKESRLKQKLLKFQKKLQQVERESKEQLLAQERQHADKLATLNTQLQQLHIQPHDGLTSGTQKSMVELMDKWSGWFIDCLDKVYKDICSYTEQAEKAKSCEMRQLLRGYHEYLLTQAPFQQGQLHSNENIPPRMAATPPLQRLQPQPRTTPPERLFTRKSEHAREMFPSRLASRSAKEAMVKSHSKPLDLNLSEVSDGSVFLPPPSPIKTS
ncbi:centrosomal protein of 152 kDa-like [Dermacentor albipictus]|uniref:centrosomal protein of 152 kDa-like n=1 Tax=Dermacentor albipictus TaxID=60249 RepID=UPI0031FCCC15